MDFKHLLILFQQKNLREQVLRWRKSCALFLLGKSECMFGILASRSIYRAALQLRHSSGFAPDSPKNYFKL
jgi:hypothetical protein